MKTKYIVIIFVLAGLFIYYQSTQPTQKEFQNHICDEVNEGVMFRCGGLEITHEDCLAIANSADHNCRGALPEYVYQY